jgi:hypothetical protein
MIKKQKSRRRKRIVVVKRKSNVAKNSNNIVIKIDNSNKRKGNSQRRKPKQPEPEPEPEPSTMTITRNYQDIGNYTDEIVKRNKAVQDALKAQSTSRLPTPVMEEPSPTANEEPMITPPKIKRDEVMGKSTSRLPTMNLFSTINPLDENSTVRRNALSTATTVKENEGVVIPDATPLKSIGEKEATHFIVKVGPDKLLSYKNTKANLTRANKNNYEILKYVNMTDEQEKEYKRLYMQERVQIHREKKTKK